MKSKIKKFICAVMALAITCTVFGCSNGSEPEKPGPNPPGPVNPDNPDNPDNPAPEADSDEVVMPQGPLEVDKNTTNVFVDCDAQDGGDGSEAKPFKTLAAARDYVRTINAAAQKDIHVYIHDGYYFQDETFVMNEKDSAADGKRIVWMNYPNERPVISGGLKVEGWRFVNGLYETKLKPKMQIRNLFVNGERKERAGDRVTGLTPDGDAFKIYDKSNVKDIAEWENVDDVELISTNSWKMYRIGIEKVEGGKVYPDAMPWKVGKATGQHGIAQASLMRIENAKELLNEENEWYYNSKTGRIYYKPQEDEKLRSSEVIVPVTEGLMRMENVSNVTVRGLSFMYDAWNYVEDHGYLEHQAGVLQAGTGWFDMYKTPGSVAVENGHNVEISENYFKGLGINALSVHEGSKDVLVKSNHFEDVSGAAISVSNIRGGDPRVPDDPSLFYDHHPSDESKITERITLENNVIENIGREYWSNPGIFIGYARNITVKNNTIHDVPYSAVSMGWGWGYPDDRTPSVCENNQIVGNKIYRFMQVMHDGGGIYTLGEQRDSVIAENYLACQGQDYAYIYLDNGSARFTVRNNVVSSKYGEDFGRCSHWGFVSQYAPGNDLLLAHNNLVLENWYAEGLDLFRWQEASENKRKDNVQVSIGQDWPKGAQKIIDQSGSTLISKK